MTAFESPTTNGGDIGLADIAVQDNPIPETATALLTLLAAPALARRRRKV